MSRGTSTGQSASSLGRQQEACLYQDAAGNDLKYTAFSCKVIEGREEIKNRAGVAVFQSWFPSSFLH